MNTRRKTINIRIRNLWRFKLLTKNQPYFKNSCLEQEAGRCLGSKGKGRFYE